jgi:hypothetical protein
LVGEYAADIVPSALCGQLRWKDHLMLYHHGATSEQELVLAPLNICNFAPSSTTLTTATAPPSESSSMALSAFSSTQQGKSQPDNNCSTITTDSMTNTQPMALRNSVIDAFKSFYLGEHPMQQIDQFFCI